MNIKDYLKRIGYRGSSTPNLATLTALMNANLRAIPFENISNQIGENIRLKNEWLFEKIVYRNRGGFCYELNGLFAWLLREMGFHVKLLSAQVRSIENDPPTYGEDFDHLVLKVDLDEPWLVDVGFGRAYNEPLALRIDEIQHQREEKFKITQENDYYYYWRFAEVWVPDYRFSLTEYQLKDFSKRCHYHQTSSKSLFTKAWFVTHLSKNGRETLRQDGRDFRFITTTSTGKQNTVIQGMDNAVLLLEDVFGISETVFERPRKSKKSKRERQR